MYVVQVFTRSDTLGGISLHVCDLSLALMDSGHEVLVAVGGNGPVIDELERKGIPHLSLRHMVRPICPFTDLLCLIELCRLLKKLSPDLVAVHSAKAGVLGRLASRILGLPVVFTAHGWAFEADLPAWRRALFQSIERFAGLLSNRVITVSHHDRQVAIRRRAVPDRAMVTVHGGVSDIPHALRASPAKQPVDIMMVARFEDQKDHPTLLRALALIDDVPWSLSLVGDGPNRTKIEGLSAELGIGHRVRFLGASNEVAKMLAEAQVFVLASNWEGFPLSILEAMRAGLPVVATDVGGVSEAVADGKTGFLVPKHDHNVLRDRLQTLLAHPHLRLQMGQAARTVYEADFTFDNTMQKTLTVYQEVLMASIDR